MGYSALKYYRIFGSNGKPSDTYDSMMLGQKAPNYDIYGLFCILCSCNPSRHPDTAELALYFYLYIGTGRSVGERRSDRHVEFHDFWPDIIVI